MTPQFFGNDSLENYGNPDFFSEPRHHLYISRQSVRNVM